MNCRNASFWLLTSRCAEGLPKALRSHLKDCPRCRRRHQRLIRLEKQLQTTPKPGSEAGLAKFLAGIPDLPAHEPARTTSSVPSYRRPALYWAASILLLIGLGCVMLYILDGPRSEVVEAPPPAAPRAEDRLVTRFVRHDLMLADTTVPSNQWKVLAEMADDLRAEAARLADDQSPEDLPMVAGLYERVLQRGVIGRAACLPDQERRELQRTLAQHLRTQDSEMTQRFRQAPPGWMTLLQPIHKATRQTADQLAAEKVPVRPETMAQEALPNASNYRQLLLSALVMSGLRLAEETDPLKRADCCSDVADHLLKALVTASFKGDQQNIPTLGKHLGDFVKLGVSANLDRVASGDPRVVELEEVRLRTDQIKVALDDMLDQLASKPGPAKLDPASLDRLKELGKMVKELEKGLKKAQKAFKDDKGKGKDHHEREREEKEHEKDHKSKGKSKSSSLWAPERNARDFSAPSACASLRRRDTDYPFDPPESGRRRLC